MLFEKMTSYNKSVYNSVYNRQCRDPQWINPFKEMKTKTRRIMTSRTKIGTTQVTDSELLEVKTLYQREKILKELAMKGVMLPEGTTNDEKQLIANIRLNLRLPPKPKSAYMRHLHAKAAEARILLPLQGKTSKEKERILRGLIDMKIPLPERWTVSDKAIIAKIQTKSQLFPTQSSTEKSSEKKELYSDSRILKRKSVSFSSNQFLPKPNIYRSRSSTKSNERTKSLTEKIYTRKVTDSKQPEDKTQQREKILRAMKSVMLPEGKYQNEKKGRMYLGFSNPSSAYMKNSHAKAGEARTSIPLQGKTLKHKERILKGGFDMKIPLPERWTVSDKAVIAKIRTKSHSFSPQSSTATSRKYSEKNELHSDSKMFNRKSMSGDPISVVKPKAKSKKTIMNNSFQPIPLFANSNTIFNAEQNPTKVEAAHLLRSSFTKVPSYPITTPSYKKRPRNKYLSTQVEFEKMKKMKELIMLGATTSTDKKLMKNTHTELGFPSEPKKTAGLLLPLQGKTFEEKYKILRKWAEMGFLLPDGSTKSEKKLIAEVKAQFQGTNFSRKDKERKVNMSSTKYYHDKPTKLKEVKQNKKMLTLSEDTIFEKEEECAYTSLFDSTKQNLMVGDTGLLQSVDGKSHEEKEIILKTLAGLGLSLPSGRTESEKCLILKVKADLYPCFASDVQKSKPNNNKSQLSPENNIIENKEPSSDLDSPALSIGEVTSETIFNHANIQQMSLVYDLIKANVIKAKIDSVFNKLDCQTLLEKVFMKMIHQYDCTENNKQNDSLDQWNDKNSMEIYNGLNKENSETESPLSTPQGNNQKVIGKYHDLSKSSTHLFNSMSYAKVCRMTEFKSLVDQPFHKKTHIIKYSLSECNNATPEKRYKKIRTQLSFVSFQRKEKIKKPLLLRTKWFPGEAK